MIYMQSKSTIQGEFTYYPLDILHIPRKILLQFVYYGFTSCIILITTGFEFLSKTFPIFSFGSTSQFPCTMLHVTCAIHPYTGNKEIKNIYFLKTKRLTSKQKRGVSLCQFLRFHFQLLFALRLKVKWAFCYLPSFSQPSAESIIFLGTAPYLNFNLFSTSKSNFNNETNIKHNKLIHVTRFLLRCMPMASNLENDVKNQRILIERRGFLFDKTLWN